MVENGTGTTYLATTNSYTGGTTIQMGTVALTGAGTLGSVGAINIDAGGTLDVSGATSPFYSLSAANTFIAAGTGTGVGSTAATIKAAVNGSFNLGSQPITLTYDGSHPALYVSQGQLLFENNAFTVNTVNGSTLTNGIYTLMQQASGYIGSAGPYTVSGTALPTGGTNAVVVSNNVVLLTINTPFSTVATNSQSAPGTQSGVAITGGTGVSYWWLGGTNGNTGLATSWSTNDTPSGTPVVAPDNVAPNNLVGIFNLSASNNIPVVTANTSGYYIGGYIINNSNSVTLTANYNATINGFTNGSSSANFGANNVLYGIVVNPGAGPTAVSGLQLGSSQTWLNNGNGLLTVSNLVYNAPSLGITTVPLDAVNTSATLTLGGAGNILLSASVVDTGASKPFSLNYNGSATLYLSNTNNYSGTTTISSGTLSLTNIGNLGNSSRLVIGAGATLDLSGLVSPTFALTNQLTVGGTGTNQGISGATINGVAGGTVNLSLTPITMNYDGTHPALYISQGILYLLNNTFTINTPGQVPLTNGTYVIAQQQTGNIINGGNYTVQGTALGAGATASITASNNLLVLTISGATGGAVPITGSTQIKYWWMGTNNAIFAANSSWSASSTNILNTGYPSSSASNNIGIFNYPASNSLSTVVSVAANNTFGGLIFNNSSTTTLNPTTTSASFTLNGFTNDNTGVYYGITLNAGAGAVAIGLTNSATTNLPIVLARSQTWVNNGAGVLAISNNVTASVATTLTLSGTNNIYFNGAISNSSTAPITLLQNGVKTTYLAGSNNYTGGTIIQSGTVALVGTGTIGTSNSVNISAGGTLDVSGLTTNYYVLPASDGLIASGAGTGSAAATIIGKASGTVSLGSDPVMLNYNGISPALSIAQGTLALSNNVFVINSTTAIPLTNGTYVVAHQTTGSITNLGTGFGLFGTALAAGYTYTLFTSGSDLILAVGAQY